MRSSEVIENLEEGDLPSEVFSIFAVAQSFSRQWGQRLPKGEIQPLKQAGADLQTKLGKPLAPAPDSVTDCDGPATFFFFNHLSVNQLWMRFFDWDGPSCLFVQRS